MTSDPTATGNRIPEKYKKELRIMYTHYKKEYPGTTLEEFAAALMVARRAEADDAEYWHRRCVWLVCCVGALLALWWV